MPSLTGLAPARRLILIRNELNHGFAKGNNIGIPYALETLYADFVMLLNNDTVVDLAFLKELIKTAGSDESIGVLAPKMYFYEYNGRSDVIRDCEY